MSLATMPRAGADPVTTYAELHTNHDTYVYLEGVDGVVPLVPAVKRRSAGPSRQTPRQPLRWTRR